MKKKLFASVIMIIAMLGLVACKGTKILTCDGCGKEIKVAADSNMNDDWILYCKDCEKELGLDK